MKIINREAFLKLPSGVFYSKFDGTEMEGLYLKHESIGNDDWIYQCLLDEPKLPEKDDYSLEKYELFEKSFKDGVSFEMDYFQANRDGLYEKEQLFAVYEKKDVEKLKRFLESTLNKYPEI